MKSSELASLAGVTVRALRHYHQLGVLPEPGRGLNGYRDYDARDLIRLLRIKRLSAIGVRLEAMSAVLDPADDDSVPVPLLDALEAEIDAELTRLQQQKLLITGLRGTKGLDLPPELAQVIDGFAESATPEVRRMDRDQAVLLAHLAGEEGLSGLAEVYERLSSPDLAGQVLQFYADFAGIAADSSVEDLQRLVARFVKTVAVPVRDALAGSDALLFTDGSAAAAVFNEYRYGALNLAQQRALTLMIEQLEGTD